MGMFDHVIIHEDVDLPEWDKDDYDYGWQSKSIQDRPMMDRYRIWNGRLYKRTEVVHEIKDEWQEFMDEHGYDVWNGWMADDDVDWEDIPDGSAREVVDEEWEDVEYDGTFEFHTLIQEDPQTVKDHGSLEVPSDYAIDEWWCYEAKFADGELEEITLVEMKDNNDE